MKTKYLKWWDILIVTIIMFGPAIFSSTVSLFATAPSGDFSENLNFSSTDDIRATITELIQIGIAFVYLWKRKFDFSEWKYKVTIKGILFAIVLFLLIAALFDILTIATSGWEWASELMKSNSILDVFASLKPMLIIFSLLNGFFEEVFFLGVCLALEPKYQKFGFIYSLLIRFLFHTYQGIVSALGICFILGIIYFVWYKKKDNNLFTITLSHSLGDIFGLSFINFL